MASGLPAACGAHRDDLVALALGDAAPSVEADLRAHLVRCPACHDYLTAMQITLAAVRTLPQPEPSPRIFEAVLAAASEAVEAPPAPVTAPSAFDRLRDLFATVGRRPILVGAAAVAVLVVAVAATLTFVAVPDPSGRDPGVPVIALDREPAAGPSPPVSAVRPELPAEPAAPTPPVTESPAPEENLPAGLLTDEVQREVASPSADAAEDDKRADDEEASEGAGRGRRSAVAPNLQEGTEEERAQTAVEQQGRPDRFRLARDSGGDSLDADEEAHRNVAGLAATRGVTTGLASLDEPRREAAAGPVGGSVTVPRDGAGGGGLGGSEISSQRPGDAPAPIVSAYVPPAPSAQPSRQPSAQPSSGGAFSALAAPAQPAAPASPPAYATSTGAPAAAPAEPLAYTDLTVADDGYADSWAAADGSRSAGRTAVVQAESVDGRGGEAEGETRSAEVLSPAALAFRQAESLERLGRWSETARAYELFVARYPADPRADEARWRAAQAYLRSGATVRAEAILRRLVGTPEYDAHARSALEQTRRARSDSPDEATVPLNVESGPAVASPAEPPPADPSPPAPATGASAP